MSVQFQDYYKILGVSRSSTSTEIQKSYRKLARQYHPDVNKDDKSSEEKFKKVTEAYEVLKNPDSRKKYDLLGSNWKAGDNFRAPPGWQNINFDFSSFSNMGNRGSTPGFGGGSAGGFSSFFDSIFAATRAASNPNPRPKAQSHSQTQPKATIAESQLNISPWEAALGAVIEITTLSGRVKLKIPAGSQSGTKMRLKGKGPITGQGPSDLYIILQIKVPAKVTVKEKELFEKLSKESRFNPRA